MGVLKPQYGKIKKEKELKMAMLPQNVQVLFHYDTLWEEFLENSHHQEQKAQEMMSFLKLDKKVFSHPYDLSGGEMERAAIGKLLLQEADFLLMDEPTKGLDAWLKNTLAGLMKKMTDQNITILMVTHDPQMASRCKRVIFLKDGYVMNDVRKEGTEEEFYRTIIGEMEKF